MKPTLSLIYTLRSNGKSDIAKHLERLRESRHTRYANTSSPSQRQRRKAARIRHPHGF